MIAAPPGKAMAVRCTATGAKSIAPAMTASDVCARFVRTLGIAMRGPVAITTDARAPADGLVVELRFLPQGVASAQATRLRGGRAQKLPLFELAVSDRRFAAGDIDTLAADVARGMTLTAK